MPYRPKLDPNVDLAGATPETLARALFRPLRPRAEGESVVGGEPPVGENVADEPEDRNPVRKSVVGSYQLRAPLGSPFGSTSRR